MAVSTPPFDPRAGKRMKLKDAKRWTARFRDNYNQPIEAPTLAHYFGKDFLESLLNEDTCVGIRIYQAIDDLGVPRVVIVGVDEQGKDLLPRHQDDPMVPEDGDGVGETTMVCPENCDPNSPLMQ